MRAFFITFAFIVVFSVYPKIVSIIYTSNETQETKGTLIVVSGGRKNIQQTSGVVGGNYPTIATPVEPKVSNNYDNSENIFYKPIDKQNIVTNVNYNKLPDNIVTKYKDGEYIGVSADAYYGYVKAKIIVSNGKISDIKLLKFPNEVSNSIYISMQALPLLESEVIQVQDGNVDIISGATYTSMAFKESIKSAISKAVM